MTVRVKYVEGFDMNSEDTRLNGHPDPSGQLFSKNGKDCIFFVMKIEVIKAITGKGLAWCHDWCYNACEVILQ